MSQKQGKKQPEKDDVLKAIQGMKTVALGLDFSPDYDAIRAAYHPVEINQIRDTAGEGEKSISVQPLQFDTLIDLVDALQKQSKVTILTKQPSVVAKFCEENKITATVFGWKLGGPSFMINKKEERRDNKAGNIVSGNNGENESNKINQEMEYIITDEVL